MSPKTTQILRWVFGALVTALFLFSAIGKITASEEMLKMATKFGLDASIFKTLGIIEVICALLFLYPRTGVLGTLLLAAWMGGAIATHLEHGESVIPVCVIQAILWIVAVFRFPELKNRLMGNP